jgi:hypothetical protein
MRISDHVLEIERGRYNKINREQRICRQCHLNVIEDEEHLFEPTPSGSKFDEQSLFGGMSVVCLFYHDIIII